MARLALVRFPLAGYWLTLALVLLTALTGCAVPSTAQRDLARAYQADSLGHPWTAFHLYRSAARGGSLEAQMYLATAPTSGTYPLPWTAALVSPRPDRAERQMWAREAPLTAQRLADAGDPAGHEALASFALFGETRSGIPTTGFSPADYAVAKGHLEEAIRLGSTRAVSSLAFAVWNEEGPLAAEPYFRQSLAEGIPGSAWWLSHIAMERPALERGLRRRDVPGDLSLVDLVGAMRILRDAGNAEGAEEAARQIEGFRAMAADGNAQADSLLRAVGAAGLLG